MCSSEGEETKDKHAAYTAIFGHITVWHKEREKTKKKQRKTRFKTEKMGLVIL